MSNDLERLDGENGILWMPNADKLFDRGFITFDDNGNLMISPRLSEIELMILGIKKEMKLPKMTSRMIAYMKEHRVSVFKN